MLYILRLFNVFFIKYILIFIFEDYVFLDYFLMNCFLKGGGFKYICWNIIFLF